MNSVSPSDMQSGAPDPLICPDCREEICIPGISKYEHEECIWTDALHKEYSRRLAAWEQTRPPDWDYD